MATPIGPSPTFIVETIELLDKSNLETVLVDLLVMYAKVPSGEKVTPDAPLNPLIVLITPGVASARGMCTPENPNVIIGARRTPKRSDDKARRLA